MTSNKADPLIARYRIAYREAQKLYREICKEPGGYKVAEMIEDEVRDSMSDEQEWEKRQEER